MAKMIFTVQDEQGVLQWICEKQEFAENFIKLYGNENWTISSEEMC